MIREEEVSRRLRGIVTEQENVRCPPVAGPVAATQTYSDQEFCSLNYLNAYC